MATPEDEEGIMALCRQLHEENGKHPINENRVRGMVQHCLGGELGLIGVIGDSDDLKGCILLLIDPLWYSDSFHLLELFNFVRSDCRKSDYARSLISYAKRCSDETGLDLTIGVLSNIRMEAKVRLYDRLVPRAGSFFIYTSAKAQAEAA